MGLCTGVAGYAMATSANNNYTLKRKKLYLFIVLT